uniref:Acetyltransferase n=1 Tax=Pseudomonas sp. GLE121 TaxID=1329969 RepID=R4L171_9PSED|nr:sugar O-acetyltransferase [Pseudomonas sp. GLE121]AGL12849.1 acetyltransferase [Pseudomonas sp. GLE121]
MIALLVARLKRRLSPRQFVQVLATHDLGKKHVNRLLRKTGVATPGDAVIRAPFYFERGNIRLGHRVFINTGCVFLDEAPISIGDRTMLGPKVSLCTTGHDTHPDRRATHHTSAPITIGENVWIGAGVVVLPGVTIGANSVIAANSVVTTDIPENVLYAGSPARFKRSLLIDPQD